MSKGGYFNNAGRRSGGERPARLNAPPSQLSREDVILLVEEMRIRREFGEAGVKRFWELVMERDERIRQETDIYEEEMKRRR